MKVSVLAAVAGAALIASANASTTTFFAEDFNPTGVGTGNMPNSVAQRATFAGQLVGVGSENFESYATGTQVPPPLAINFVGAGTATLMASTSTVSILGAPGGGRFATSGSKFVETSAGGDFNIVFNNPGGVAAFGFYGTDLGDFGNQLTLRFTRNDNSTYDVVVPHSTDPNGGGATSGRAIFFGMIASASDTFKRVEFLNNPGGVDVFGFDDMMVGSLQQVLPLPAAAWMGLAGLAGLGLVRRRIAR